MPTSTPTTTSETPPHYDFAIQPIDAAKCWLSPAEFCGYLRGCVLKYLVRYPQKGGVNDLRKAHHYLSLLIAELEPTENASAPAESEADEGYVCPRVRSGEREYAECPREGCRCNDVCCCSACCDEHRRAFVAATG